MRVSWRRGIPYAACRKVNLEAGSRQHTPTQTAGAAPDRRGDCAVGAVAYRRLLGLSLWNSSRRAQPQHGGERPVAALYLVLRPTQRRRPTTSSAAVGRAADSLCLLPCAGHHQSGHARVPLSRPGAASDRADASGSALGQGHRLGLCGQSAWRRGGGFKQSACSAGDGRRGGLAGDGGRFRRCAVGLRNLRQCRP